MKDILNKILSTFPESESEAVNEIVMKTKDFSLWKNETQIWVSIIVLSGARLSEFEKILEEAKNDWRDVVIAAGLAIDDWEKLAMTWISKNRKQ